MSRARELEALAERVEKRAALETACGNRTTNPGNLCVLLDDVLAALRALASEAQP